VAVAVFRAEQKLGRRAEALPHGALSFLIIEISEVV